MRSKASYDFVIHSPEEEYASYVQQQIELAIRFAENSKAELYREVLELGLKTLHSCKKS
jgi:hypothetical protein